jgi:hypothetical protein
MYQVMAEVTFKQNPRTRSTRETECIWLLELLIVLIDDWREATKNIKAKYKYSQQVQHALLHWTVHQLCQFPQLFQLQQLVESNMQGNGEQQAHIISGCQKEDAQNFIRLV